MATVAVVDIGSNSTRLLVAQVSDGRVDAELERRSTVTRLGAGVDHDGMLREDAMQRVYATLADYETAIARHGADARIAVLTSAVRDSANGERFAASVGERFGFSPHVLSGDEEARLTFLGATSERDLADATPTLVFDIGGGSTEMVIGAGREVSFHVSTQAGVVRQTERHLHSDPPPEADQRELTADVEAIIAAAVPDDQAARVGRAIGVAGTATSLAAIAQGLDPYDPARVHGYQLSRAEGEQILARLATMPLSERREVAGLHPDRAPTIVAGGLIFLAVARRFGLETIEISDHDILRGAALALGNDA
ncbi:MAG: Ppx/GppA family phosphatase [Actinomycetota bacterium]|nr:Ppx/GppA family phosphatase [Actinomycetota bacterium]